MRSVRRDAYLARIGVSEPGAPDLGLLSRLHAAHVAAIPFENLDILLGRGISLDPSNVFDKLVTRRRGGYCFEQNALFRSMLEELGYEVIPLEARVRTGTTTLRPRTHMVLVVRIADRSWVADVGFGGEGLFEPVPMDGGESSPAAGLIHRVVAEKDAYVVQARRTTVWEDQYAFALQPVHAVDFEMANWFTSTYPQSPFVRMLTAQRTTREIRYVLRYPTFNEIRESSTATRELERAELMPLLRDVFLIDLPADTVFPAIDTIAESRG
jgi:N-hydroxyarylamine O-acetyltransferase